MTPQVAQLVRETIELTGAPRPALMADDAPTLSENALTATDRSFYLVGLIGGKDVGKSALVNALVGRNITASTGFGPGTEIVVAYAHARQEPAVRELLERETPGQFRIVTHEAPNLRRQVLLDLPDIDSHFASHPQITRTMLRHMLYPVWLVSVEKYADLQPQQMLTKVAAGNAPGNFVFCLNKVDQLGGFKRDPLTGSARGDGNPWESDPDAMAELRDDYARRVQRTLALADPPRVFMISATHPEAYELGELAEVLSREKSAETVRRAQESAERRQDGSLLAWLENQQLSARAQRLARLQEDAQELASQRIGGPMLDEVIPRLLDDPAARGAMAEEILTERVARWPVVRLVHTLLSPLFVVLRGAVSRNAAPLQTPRGFVEVVLRESGYSASDLVQTTFAQLRQSQPLLSEIYAHQRLWEQMPADLAAAELRRTLGGAIQRQRDWARQRLTRGRAIGAPIRWLLTIGAVLWFPFIQPVLHALLAAPDAPHWSWRQAAVLAVEVTGVNYLLTSAGFLIIYFLVLWLALRWNTQRRVTRSLGAWRTDAAGDPTLDLNVQTLQWIDGLIAPLSHARERMASLAKRAEELRESFTKAA